MRCTGCDQYFVPEPGAKLESVEEQERLDKLWVYRISVDPKTGLPRYNRWSEVGASRLTDDDGDLADLGADSDEGVTFEVASMRQVQAERRWNRELDPAYEFDYDYDVDAVLGGDDDYDDDDY
jgi:hypothetical protein